MRNLILILIVIFSLCQCNQSEKSEYMGEFKATLPDMIRSDRTMPEEMLGNIGLLDWTLIVRDKELVLKLSGKEYLKMSYFIEGKSLIGQYKWGDKIIYYPFYYQNKDVVYTWGMELARVK